MRYKLITIILTLLTLGIIIAQPGKNTNLEQLWVIITAILVVLTTLRWSRITKNK